MNAPRIYMIKPSLWGPFPPPRPSSAPPEEALGRCPLRRGPLILLFLLLLERDLVSQVGLRRRLPVAAARHPPLPRSPSHSFSSSASPPLPLSPSLAFTSPTPPSSRIIHPSRHEVDMVRQTLLARSLMGWLAHLPSLSSVPSALLEGNVRWTADGAWCRACCWVHFVSERKKGGAEERPIPEKSSGSPLVLSVASGRSKYQAPPKGPYSSQVFPCPPTDAGGGGEKRQRRDRSGGSAFSQRGGSSRGKEQAGGGRGCASWRSGREEGVDIEPWRHAQTSKSSCSGKVSPALAQSDHDVMLAVARCVAGHPHTAPCPLRAGAVVVLHGFPGLFGLLEARMPHTPSPQGALARHLS